MTTLYAPCHQYKKQLLRYIDLWRYTRVIHTDICTYVEKSTLYTHIKSIVKFKLHHPVKNKTSTPTTTFEYSNMWRCCCTNKSKRAGESFKLNNRWFEIVGVEPVLSAKDMADIHVEHLGVMAYAAHYQWVPERPPLHDLIQCTLNSTSGRVGETVSTFSTSILE